MTKAQAEEILRTPRFGDPAAIFARDRMRDEHYIQRLRDGLAGKSIVCIACDGSADNCKICEPDGTMILTREVVDSWQDVDVLIGVYEEIGIKPPKRNT